MAKSLRKIGPSDVFKHLILDRLLQATAARHQNGFTYVDFTPGPGHYEANDAGLGLLYRHGHAEHKKEKINLFQPYMKSLMRYNGETDKQILKFPPKSGSEPKYYPSGAGFASLHLRECDRAIYVEDDKNTLNELKEQLKRYPNSNKVTLTSGHKSLDKLAKAIVPPVNGNALVTFDLDLALERVAVSGDFKNQYFGSQQRYMTEVGNTINTMVRRFPTGTYFVPYPMTTKIPPLNLARSILKSGASQVLNCSMYLEGSRENEDSAEFGGSGVGCFIVNPPPLLDHTLAQELPRLKTEVFMPAILVDDNTKVSDTLVRYLTMKEQPWEELETSKTKMTWNYTRKAKWTPTQLKGQEEYFKSLEKNPHKIYVDYDSDDDLEEMWDILDREAYPAPHKFESGSTSSDPAVNLANKNAKDAWQEGIHEQAHLQDPVHQTKIRVRKGQAPA